MRDKKSLLADLLEFTTRSASSAFGGRRAFPNRQSDSVEIQCVRNSRVRVQVSVRAAEVPDGFQHSGSSRSFRGCTLVRSRDRGLLPEWLGGVSTNLSSPRRVHRQPLEMAKRSDAAAHGLQQLLDGRRQSARAVPCDVLSVWGGSSSSVHSLERYFRSEREIPLVEMVRVPISPGALGVDTLERTAQ